MFSAYAVPFISQGIRTAWLLIVMPRSRSMSMRSRYWARMARASTTPVICSIRSASVDLPWSMCAMMQKFRISSGGVADGIGAVRAIGDTFGSSLAGDSRPSSHGRTPAGRRPLPPRAPLDEAAPSPLPPEPPHETAPAHCTPRGQLRTDPPASDPPSGSGQNGMSAAGTLCQSRAMTQSVPQLDYTDTVVRPRWDELPAGVRQAVEDAAGARVEHAGAPARSGFSGGFAAVL